MGVIRRAWRHLKLRVILYKNFYQLLWENDKRISRVPSHLYNAHIMTGRSMRRMKENLEYYLDIVVTLLNEEAPHKTKTIYVGSFPTRDEDQAQLNTVHRNQIIRDCIRYREIINGNPFNPVKKELIYRSYRMFYSAQKLKEERSKLEQHSNEIIRLKKREEYIHNLLNHRSSIEEYLDLVEESKYWSLSELNQQTEKLTRKEDQHENN